MGSVCRMEPDVRLGVLVWTIILLKGPGPERQVFMLIGGRVVEFKKKKKKKPHCQNQM